MSDESIADTLGNCNYREGSATKQGASHIEAIHDRVYGDFTQEEFYFVTLFNLVLTLYRIPFDDALVRDLQIKLKEDAQALLAGGMG